ncbi:hypothetical protein BDN67DRAFT_1014685 [Paxillus ammoniavirescens]|nr:hypothetical protein BDN67DRAFT_1014685 [Paxillus ammoniavirescens]
MLSVLTLPLLALSFTFPQTSAHLQRTRHHHRAKASSTKPVAAAWYTGWRALEGLPLSDPYLYNETSQVMFNFDNADSFAAKGRYIRETGLRGFSMWEAGGDYDDILLDSIRRAAGFD